MAVRKDTGLSVECGWGERGRVLAITAERRSAWTGRDARSYIDMVVPLRG